jgi:hypothetical protein
MTTPRSFSQIVMLDNPPASAAELMEARLRALAEGQFIPPSGMAIHPTNIYVADTGNHRMQLLREGGGFFNEWGSK